MLHHKPSPLTPTHPIHLPSSTKVELFCTFITSATTPYPKTNSSTIPQLFCNFITNLGAHTIQNFVQKKLCQEFWWWQSLSGVGRKDRSYLILQAPVWKKEDLARMNFHIQAPKSPKCLLKVILWFCTAYTCNIATSKGVVIFNSCLKRGNYGPFCSPTCNAFTCSFDNSIPG